MDTIFIDEEAYVIMKRSEFADARVQFIAEGRETERLCSEKGIADMAGVLRFYACESNYLPDISEVTGVEHGTGLMQYDLSRVAADNGMKARGIVADSEG